MPERSRPPQGPPSRPARRPASRLASRHAPRHVRSLHPAAAALLAALSLLPLAALAARPTPAASRAADLPQAAQPPDLVDFEPDPATGRLPDGSLARDELPIGAQYAGSHGIHFGIDEDGDGIADGELPLLEQGDENPPDAFQRSIAPRGIDLARAGFEDQLGGWLLKTDLMDPARSLLIRYDVPVAAAAGQIWDIDGNANLGYEQWRVEALVVACVAEDYWVSLRLSAGARASRAKRRGVGSGSRGGNGLHAPSQGNRIKRVKR